MLETRVESAASALQAHCRFHWDGQSVRASTEGGWDTAGLGQSRRLGWHSAAESDQTIAAEYSRGRADLSIDEKDRHRGSKAHQGVRGPSKRAKTAGRPGESQGVFRDPDVVAILEYQAATMTEEQEEAQSGQHRCRGRHVRDRMVRYGYAPCSQIGGFQQSLFR